ncbi:MAG: hypothetical protein AB7N76_22095 [Planctomycetota bacterium]
MNLRLPVFLLGISLTAAAAAEGPERLDADQVARRFPKGLVYATHAKASSAYGSGYEASEATGAPSVFPRHGDQTGAWACRSTESKSEWLVVSFKPTQAVGFLVFETNRPGAIRKISDQEGQTLYETSDPPLRAAEARALWVPLAAPKKLVQLKIDVDASLVPGWPEIDAVALVEDPKAAGAAPSPGASPGAAPSTGSSAVAAPAGAERLDAERVRGGFSKGLVFATGASASSSFGSGYDAGQATGAPDVFPRHADQTGAWACSSSNSASEWLEVTFPATQALGFLVYETHQPGAIRKITDQAGTVLYETQDRPSGGSQALALWVRFKAPAPIERLRIEVDASLVSGWPEIDAVALLTEAPAEPGPGASPTPEVAPAPVAPAKPVPREAWSAERVSADDVAQRFGWAAQSSERPAPAKPALVFASAAKASSTYGDGFEPREATGAPNVFPNHGDSRGSWACKNPTSQSEWLEVSFPAAEAEGFLVFETNHPGSIRRVSCGERVLYVSTEQPSPFQQALALWLPLPAPARVDSLRIEVDASLVEGYPELDAVALVPKGHPGAPPPAEPPAPDAWTRAADPREAVRLIQEAFPKERFDPWFRGAPNAKAVSQWARRLRSFKATVGPALAFLEAHEDELGGRRSPGGQDYGAYVGWFRAQAARKVEDVLRGGGVSEWRGWVSSAVELEHKKFDSGDPDEFKQRLLTRVVRGSAAAPLVEAFEAGYLGAASAEAKQQTARARAALAAMTAQIAGLVRDRRLPKAVDVPAELSGQGRRFVVARFGKENVRGVRVTLPVRRYEWREEKGRYIEITWWEGYRLDFAAKKPGTDTWYHECLSVDRRLNEGGAPIGKWELSSGELHYSLPILPENVPE